MATELGKAYVQIMPSAQGIKGSITDVLSPEASSAGQSAGETIGSQIASFATKAIAALGLGKMISDSITNGMDFEQSMTKASTLFSGTSEELAKLQTELVGISSKTGVAASELAEAAYSAESASVPMENLGGMIEASAKLATAGFTDVDTALSATAKTMNAYGMMTGDAVQTQKNLEEVQKILIQTQNKGITTVGELGASLAQVTPTAAAFGVSFKQVGASLAGMTAQGTPTAQATTQLNSLIAELGKNGTMAAKNLEKAAKGTAYAGMSFTEMMEHGLDLNGVLDLMGGLAEKDGLAMVDMFSSIEAGKAAMSINNSDWVGNMEAMATEADVVGEAYSTMSDTVSFKMDQFKNSVKNLGIEAFTASADVLMGAFDGISQILTSITPSLQSLGTAFGNLFTSIGQMVGQMLGLDEGFSTTEAITALLTTVIEELAGAITFLSENLDWIIPIVAGVVTAFVAFKAALAISALITAVTTAFSALSAVLLANPIGLIVAAIAGLVIGIKLLWDNCEGFRNIVTGLWDHIKEFAAWLLEGFVGVGKAIADTFETIKTTVTDAWNAITNNPIVQTMIDGWQKKFENFKKTLAGIWDGIKTYAAGAWELIKNVVLGPVVLLIDLLTGDFTKFKDDLGNIWDNIKNAAENIWNGIKQILGSIVEGLIGNIKEQFEGMKTALGNIWDGIKTTASDTWTGIKDTTSDLVGALKTTLSNDWDNIKSKYEEHGGGMQGAAAALWTALKDAYTLGFDTLDTLTDGKLSELKDMFSEKFQDIIDGAVNWGRDIIQGLADGISEKIGAVKDAAASAAGAIREFLHFSEPDVGPLSDFHTYMPDMIKELSAGIIAGIPTIENSMSRLTDAMLPQISAGDLSGGAAVMSGAPVTINVYGAEGQDEKVLAQRISEILYQEYYRQGAAFA